MKRVYQVVSQSEITDVRQYFVEHGHALLPIIEVIVAGKAEVDELIAELGKVALEVYSVSNSEIKPPLH